MNERTSELQDTVIEMNGIRLDRTKEKTDNYSDVIDQRIVAVAAAAVAAAAATVVPVAFARTHKIPCPRISVALSTYRPTSCSTHKPTQTLYRISQ